MKMFDPDRPSISPEQKALLLEGSAIPHITIVFFGETVRLSVLVRDFSDTKNRTYAYRNYFTPIKGVEQVLLDYLDDPEKALETYFNWKDQRPSARPESVERAVALIAPTITADTFDLL